jgi:hypothetical protein
MLMAAAVIYVTAISLYQAALLRLPAVFSPSSLAGRSGRDDQ